MPIFNDEDAQAFKTNGSGFQFSGANIDNLGASEYTLVSYGCDRSYSVLAFVREIENCVKSSLEGCLKSPRADNLLVRTVSFGGSNSQKGVEQVQEEHGFRPLADCHVKNYDNFLQPGGGTPLYDATVNCVDALATYGKELLAQRYQANGILVILTDGEESNASILTVKSVKEAFARARMSEALESLVTILIGINVTDPSVSRSLKAFKDEAGFDQYIEVANATPATFAKVAGFITASVSSQSQALGTGAKSQLITF